ncbi:unnamed protein product [Somion occarium]|uniref:Mediator of RNA polymerase II transcription subunit 14 n=1 Tax=Somion occarium TaxID=3059160 RepID=A0ABP1DLC1_9APHY
MDTYSQVAGPSNGNLTSKSGIAPEIVMNGVHEPTLEELERELPYVGDGQIHLGELVSRTVQTIYAELTELAETMPNMSDANRKRTLAEWVVKTKKQVVKLYAVVRWARDAGVVQKAMNVTAFLMDQNAQFEEAINRLKSAKDGLDPARMRNHDLLTSLDVLTTGSYRRLPTIIKQWIVPPDPLTDEEVANTLAEVEHAMRYRLRMIDVIPLEMSKYRISDGRSFFTAPHLFEASLCVRGAKKDDGWFFVDVEFLFTIGGDVTSMQDFPRKPVGPVKRHIADEADARLAFYLPVPENLNPPPGVEIPSPRKLPEGVIDAPLVRVFNFLQMMSMSYQLEILWFQAERLRSLGWADYLKVEMTNHRRTLTLSYWIRKPPPSNQRVNIPRLGGTLTISIVKSETSSSPVSKAHPPHRSAKAQVLAELQERSKLGERKRPSDTVEHLRFEVKWEPQRVALGMSIPFEAVTLPEGELRVDPDNLDVESLLRKVLFRHSVAILSTYQQQLQHATHTIAFAYPTAVKLISDDVSTHLRVHLCADEVVVVSIDMRTGRLGIRDTGDLAASGRAPRFQTITEYLNINPPLLADFLLRLRLNTITDLAEQKAEYLGLQCYRQRNIPQEDLQRFGPTAKGYLFIQLSMFSANYLVLVITDLEFRYALIEVKRQEGKVIDTLGIEDLGWIDVRRMRSGRTQMELNQAPLSRKRKAEDANDEEIIPEPGSPASFKLESQVLRELYAYCCARVAYTKVEHQLKSHSIPSSYVKPAAAGGLPPGLGRLQSSLINAIPALCVKSSDLLAGAEGVEAAMPNIRIIPLHWWADQRMEVVTCVKLKYVQQPLGKRAGNSSVIRPSKRIIYDANEAVVSFLSEDVDKCVNEFLEEWAKVSKMVVIAREVAQMASEKNWGDVRLLSFDLQTVEFAYAPDYSVSITCGNHLFLDGPYELYFSRPRVGNEQSRYNPHTEVEPFMRNILRHGSLGPSLHRLVSLLRETLPIVLVLQEIQDKAEQSNDNVDTFAKSAEWFRVLYGDFKHALDFRLMKGSRVLVLDASHSLFPAAEDAKSKDSKPINGLLVLHPIPDFSQLVSETLKDLASQKTIGTVHPVDTGLICDGSAVTLIGKALYERVLQKLKQHNTTSFSLSS